MKWDLDLISQYMLLCGHVGPGGKVLMSAACHQQSVCQAPGVHGTKHIVQATPVLPPTDPYIACLGQTQLEIFFNLV